MPKSGPIKWHGGKSYLAPKIIELMPPHTRYCEPFFGGGAVLLQKPCDGVAEFANDLNRELTNFWSVLRDETLFKRFGFHVVSTPLSQIEFDRARKDNFRFADHGEDVHGAVRFFVLNRQSRQALGRDFATPTSRLRRGMNEQVSAWLSAVDGLPEFHARLKRVEIRCMDAKEFIRELDSPETCFYCDPPYMHETRNTTKEYGEHEMSHADHEDLLVCLSEITGKFLLSGYRSELYDEAANQWGWRRIDFEIPNQASSKRTKEIKTECVWVNY
jgi:DNA adenine methylase